MSNENYKMRLKTDNLEIEVQGDKEFVVEKFNELRNSAQNLETIKEKQQPKSVNQATLPDTLPSFLRKINVPEGDPDLMAVFAYWLYFKEEIDPITSSEIEECYDLTRITKSKNISSALSRCSTKGYLIKQKEKKDNRVAYRISIDGEEYVKSLKTDV